MGGIYTVIRSKAGVSVEELGDQYCLLGPFKEMAARAEVEYMEFPKDSLFTQAVQKMRDWGCKVKYLHNNSRTGSFKIKVFSSKPKKSTNPFDKTTKINFTRYS